MNEREKVEGIVLICEPTEEYLNERQRVTYRSHREKLIKWLARQGKDPENLAGYAHDTCKTYSTIIDQFHRHVWTDQDRFTLNLSQEHAEEYLRGQILSDEDYSSSHLDNTKLALKAYFRFSNDEWDPDLTIPSTLL